MTYWDPQNAPDVDSEQSDEEYVDMLIRQNPEAYEAAEAARCTPPGGPLSDEDRAWLRDMTVKYGRPAMHTEFQRWLDALADDDTDEVSLVRPPQDRDDLSPAEQAAFDAYVDEDTDRGDR